MKQLEYIQAGALPLLLALGLAACEQTSQQLPFSAVTATEKTVGAAGAIVSSPAGASVQFPAGAISGATTVGVTPVAAPAAAQPSGAQTSTSAFRIEPAGLELAKPADLSLSLSGKSDLAWLASVVNVTPAGVQELGATRVDLASGTVSSQITRLGTVSAVIPEPAAVVEVKPLGTAQKALAAAAASGVSTLAATGTDSVTMACGRPGARCRGLAVEMSANVMSMTGRVAAVYPQVQASLRVSAPATGSQGPSFSGAISRATGRITVNTAVRAQMKSGRVAENVGVYAAIEPTGATTVTETASQLTFTNMRFRVSGSGAGMADSQESVTSLVIPKATSTGHVTVSRKFEIRNESGKLENATVSVTVPIRIHQ